MSQDPRIKALANQAAVKIKALTDAHESQIEAIYREFQEQVAILQGSNADSLHGSSVTPSQVHQIELGDSNYVTDPTKSRLSAASTIHPDHYKKRILGERDHDPD